MGFFDGIFKGVQKAVQSVEETVIGNTIGTPPTPVAPPPPPNPNQSTMDALQKQLNQELQMRRSQVLFSDNLSSVQDPKVKSAGQLLLGSY